MSRRLAVVVLLSVGLAAVMAMWWRASLSVAEAAADAEDISAYVAQMSEELRATRADAELLVDILAVLDDERLRIVELRTRPGAPSAARVLAGREGFVLLARDVPALPTGRVYQLWFETGQGGPTSGGTFGVNPFGTGTVVRFRPIPASARVLVTEEPTGGSPAPTAAPLLAGS